jgi:hypothetical protein
MGVFGKIVGLNGKKMRTLIIIVGAGMLLLCSCDNALGSSRLESPVSATKAEDSFVTVIGYSEDSALAESVAESDSFMSAPTESTEPESSEHAVEEPVTEPLLVTESETAPERIGSSLSISSAPSVVHRNEDSTIAIVGQPNTEYRLRVYYKSESEADGLGVKTSDDEGLVSWTWHIGGRTSLGDFYATVNGGGETIRHDFTIIE